MNDFIAKPVDPDQLYGTLLRWLPASTMTRQPGQSERGVLPAEILAIPGLDAECGLKMLNGHIPTYLRLLRRLADDHGADMARLREQMSLGDRENAGRIAHTLKGGSGNLGVTGVQRLAADLEVAIKEGQEAAEIEALASHLESELQRLKTACRAALPDEVSDAGSGDTDWTLVRRILTELEPLLLASCMQANLLFDAHAAVLRAALGPLGADLEKQLAHFLYPESLETLREVWRKVPELASEGN